MSHRLLLALLPVGLLLLLVPGAAAAAVVGSPAPTAHLPPGTYASTASVSSVAFANNQFGTQTIGPFSTPAHDLLYLAVAEDYSGGGAPSLASSGLAWTLRGSGAVAGDASTWVYVAAAPTGGLSSYSFSVSPNDGGGIGYVLLDLHGYAGFDPGAAPTGVYYSSSAPSAHVLNNGRALDLAFISTIAATGTVTLTPRTGQSAVNTGPSPSYAVAAVYATYGAGSHTVGATLSVAEAGWVVADAVDTATPLSGTSVTSLGYAINQFGSQTIGPLDAAGHDLLVLAIAQDYAGGGAPSISSAGLTWSLVSEGGAAGDASTWVYEAAVPSSGLSGYSFTASPNDGGGIGYLLLDLHGWAGIDPGAPGSAAYYSSTTTTASVATHARAVDLAFISTIAATGTVSLTPRTGQTAVDTSPSPSYAVSVVYATFAASTHTVGGRLSTLEAGWVVDLAVDN
jgi:hypothetical protein